MSDLTVEFISKERAEKLTSRVQPFDSAGIQYQKVSERSPIGGTLDKYQGEWGRRQALHLLNRTMTGPSREQIDFAVDQGPEAIVELLLEDRPLPDPPVNYLNENEPFTPLGETWVDKPVTLELLGERFASLYGWQFGLLLEEGISIREKMTLFWHNHFVTADIGVPKIVYQYITLLRENALGNFRELTKAITVNPSMLLYLNGAQNTKFAPNENYARELLELFTVGKGALAGPGDYTTFTEKDVQEISRVLTGWRVRFEFETGNNAEALFNPFFHDDGEKQLSERFDNAIVTNGGENEYADLIDIIFQQDAAARFICRKLYRWFVYYVIDDEIEQTIIAPMAQILRDNDFDIKPVLRALLMSEHFYDTNSIGCIIKNPIDFFNGLLKQFKVRFPEDFQQKYALWNGIFRIAELLQMIYYQPPSVAGWKAYHQAPTYNQLWINSVTLILRQYITDVMSTTGFESFNGRFKVDALRFVEEIENVDDPNELIRGIADIVFPNSLEQAQIDVLKEVLIPGLPDFEWTFEWQAYVNNPGNDEIRLAVETRVRLLLRAMLARPEYHLS